MDYRIIRSDRKTLALEVKSDGEVVVRAPRRVTVATIEGFVNSHTEWIAKAKQRITQRQKAHKEPTEAEVSMLKALAKAVLPKKIEYYSHLTGLKCTGVKITSAKTRFGSCSGKNSICFSYLLMRYPDEAIDYVVLHELAHTRHHDHSKNFWKLVEKYMPDYKKRKELLKG
ncbi:MAG: M48 family metallopeptidase [Clostridia bacterium]|nr:M48 family metallopeptidase [Clostridia bacterium]